MYPDKEQEEKLVQLEQKVDRKEEELPDPPPLSIQTASQQPKKEKDGE